MEGVAARNFYRRSNHNKSVRVVSSVGEAEGCGTDIAVGYCGGRKTLNEGIKESVCEREERLAGLLGECHRRPVVGFQTQTRSATTLPRLSQLAPDLK